MGQCPSIPRICDNYESRWYTLFNTDSWSDDYYTPVGTGPSDDPTEVWLYNDGPGSVTVDWESSSGAQTAVVVPAGGVV